MKKGRILNRDLNEAIAMVMNFSIAVPVECEIVGKDTLILRRKKYNRTNQAWKM